ncbi:hypothetical protein [Thiomonas sp. FB-Cd]|uniref:hypothetical protein n=1 Tax=Thiomonas sp. FB-Cd TaxID=1158292 RepID=UPI0004DF2012|nr:hypothetical protein [Thiomonas sp. FB-Cd]
MSDARPKRARLHAGEEHIAQFPQVAVREDLDQTNVGMAAAWCAGHWPLVARSSLHIGSRRCQQAQNVDSGPENDTEEPMPNASINEDPPAPST